MQDSFISVDVLIMSVQDGIYMLGKAHVCSISTVRTFHVVAFETASTPADEFIILSHDYGKGERVVEGGTKVFGKMLAAL